MLSPMTTGPTGTKGGANVGIGPLPMTSITCCATSQMAKPSAHTSAIESKTVWYCLSGSFCFKPPSSAPAIPDDIENGSAISVVIGEMQAMSGIGTLGIGGACGPGNAAKAGYHGRPGTVTMSCQFLKQSPTPLATASRYLPMLPLIVAQLGEYLMRFSRPGPSRQPGMPSAVTALTLRSWNFARIFHMLCANLMPSIALDMKSLKFVPMVSQLFWW